ncbi:MAG: GNVR domain-containing protein, partial [Candidatus Binataceae bacterium]
SSEAEHSSDRLKSELEKSRERLVNAREVLEHYKASHGVFLYKTEYDAKLKVISDLEVELAKSDEGLAGSQGTLAANTYRARRASLLKILNQRQAELAEMPAIERELQLREADVEVADTTYETVAKALKDAEIKSDPVPEARLISAAAVPVLPSSPRRGIIALASMLSGLIAGAGLAFFLEYLDRRVRGIHDLEDVVGLKVIGTIPLAPAQPLLSELFSH